MAETKIMEEQWDYLIILDACRYDYFERVRQDSLGGSLEKRISIGSSTKEWRNKSFTDYYSDVVYISANPYINSLAPVKGFSAKERFHKVYDLWLEDWDMEKGTVLPGTVTRRAIEIIRANSNKRAIIHYIQPHEPYLGSAVAGPGFPSPVAGGILEGVDQGLTKRPLASKVFKIVTGVCYWLRIRGNSFTWKLREFLKLPPACPMDAVRRDYGPEVLRQAYRENLEIVLRHVADLVDALSGRIVITADHGEMLGENGCYCHWSRSSNKLLIEVPWLVIDKGKKAAEPGGHAPDTEPTTLPKEPEHAEPDEETKKQIQERLRALGYFD